MKLFRCQNCGGALHFDNTICLNCQRRVGFLQDRFEISALEPEGDSWIALANRRTVYRFCVNADNDVCNWLVPEGGLALCESCRHNRVIPDLSVPENLPRWRKIELAKRYVFRSMMRWKLPMPNRVEDPVDGLAFDIVGDVMKPDGAIEPAPTGHADGVITINIAEADDPEREQRRTAMGETYRTLIGHFRHEIGHYYWDRLVRDGGQAEPFRAVFGDEREDYEAALRRHYEAGPPSDWRGSFISAYATAHPWEDFAETWAHYLHIVDALETARSYGVRISANLIAGPAGGEIDFEPYFAASATELARAWAPLTVTINGVNRSMGQPDLYPFVLSPPVVTKLQFIHELIHKAPRS